VRQAFYQAIDIEGIKRTVMRGASNPSALMVGPGINEKEIRQDHGVEQTTGTSGSSLPEEFRYGLDQYFERIDRR
jgi:methyl coenzyme M reductase subunit D